MTVTAHTSAPIKKLVQKGVLTEQEAKDIKAEVEKENQQAKTSPFVLPLGKEAKLKLGGFIQANGEFGDVGSQFGVFPDNPLGTASHTPLHSRFFLRRARINVSGDFLENFDFKMEADFSQGDGISSSRTAFSG